MARRNFVVVGLGFGDESKGATVDALCRTFGAGLVVRFNGGAQAAHNVCAEGKHHTFSQWGSGTFAGAGTLLSRHMLVNPSRFMVESEALAAAGAPVECRAWADGRALVTTPYHVWLNRVREYARGAAKHGTTGMGVGETVVDGIARPDTVLRVWDILSGKDVLVGKLMEVERTLTPELRRLGGEHEFERLDPERIADCYLEFSRLVTILDAAGVRDLLRESQCTVYEGAQGVLLDENFGFHPHTTWSTTTPANARGIMMESGTAEGIWSVGVTRTYATRHGAGPFPTEQPQLGMPEPHNTDDGMAGQFRKGLLDLPLLKYAARCCMGLDALVVSHMDVLPTHYCRTNPRIESAAPPTSMRAQEGLTRLAWQPAESGWYDLVPDDFPRFLADQLGCRLLGVSNGPDAADRKIFADALS